MSKTTLNFKDLKQMFIKGAEFVSNECDYINELNVFPVPDGDTGTNLSITLNNACDSLKSTAHNDLFSLGKQFSRGLLMNARGNSGVIFSQIIKGFTINFKENQTELTISELVECFVNATKVAYESLTSPVEGTILTVVRETAEALKKAESDNKIETPIKLFNQACGFATESLKKTPEKLIELKEAGVVDSGGYGLCCFLNGMNDFLKDIDSTTPTKKQEKVVKHTRIVERKSFIDSFNDKNEGFGYCTEFIVVLASKIYLNQRDKDDFNMKIFRKDLSKIGDSIATVVDDNILKVHIHTQKPYEALEIASNYGEFSKVKIENMTFQFLENNPGTTLETIDSSNNNNNNNNKLPRAVKIIITVPSSNLAELYKKEVNIANSINTNIEGNPSISTFLNAIRNANSSNIIIVVDDSNIVLSASEAIKLTPKKIKIDLLKADDAASLYLACMEYDEGLNRDDNVDNMRDMLKHCSSGKISYSVKNSEMYGVKIRKGEHIGIFEKRVIISNKNIQNVCKKMIDVIVKNVRHPKAAFVIYGKKTLSEDIKFVKKYLNEKYMLQVRQIFGNQDVYPFFIAVK